MNPRETVLRILKHEEIKWMSDCLDVIVHLRAPVCERPMIRTTKDAFGVNWLYSNIPGFGCHYDPNQKPIITDVKEWKQQLVLPPLDLINWEWIESLYKDGPKENEVWDVSIMMGPLERLTSLMPLEEAFINCILEPDAITGILEEITNYKVDLINRIAKYMHPDMITLHDDWGTEFAPFISLDMWRTFIKPCMKRMYDAVKKHGMLLIQHSCGCVEPFLEDIVEMGVDGWESYQNCNDLHEIKRKFGKQLIFVGTPDVRKYLSESDQSDGKIEQSLRSLIHMLGQDGGYLPDYDLDSQPKYKAIIKKILENDFKMR